MNLRCEDFRQLLDTEISIGIDGQSVSAKVIEVQELPCPDGAPKLPFSVLLAASFDTPLQQGIYPMVLGEAGTHALFLVPVGPKDGQLTYEMIFN